MLFKKHPVTQTDLFYKTDICNDQSLGEGSYVICCNNECVCNSHNLLMFLFSEKFYSALWSLTRFFWEELHSVFCSVLLSAWQMWYCSYPSKACHMKKINKSIYLSMLHIHTHKIYLMKKFIKPSDKLLLCHILVRKWAYIQERNLGPNWANLVQMLLFMWPKY